MRLIISRNISKENQSKMRKLKHITFMEEQTAEYDSYCLFNSNSNKDDFKLIKSKYRQMIYEKKMEIELLRLEIKLGELRLKQEDIYKSSIDNNKKCWFSFLWS